MNVLYNYDEGRFRAGVRLITFLFLFVILTIPIRQIRFEPLSHLAFAAVCLLTCWLMAIAIDNRSLTGFGLELSGRWWKEFVLGISMAFMVQCLIFVLAWQMNWVEVIGFGWERASDQLWVLAFGSYFIKMLSVGFYEELMFRGYMIRNLSEGLTIGRCDTGKATIWAVLLTSVLFGFAHFFNPEASWVSTAYIILAGFMLAIPFILTGRLALSIGIHFSWNFIMGGVLGLPVSGINFRQSVINVQETGPDAWTGGLFGPEAGLLGILAMLALIAMILGYQKWMNETASIHDSFSKPYSTEEEVV